jgi:hypothetical protein
MLGCITLVGCMSPNVPKPLPKSDDVVQIEKLFPMPFEAAWDRALGFASKDGMKVITTDKPSGLIAFVAVKAGREGKLYYNMLLQPSTTGNGTQVFVFERTASGAAFDTTILDRISRSFTN